MKEITTYFYPDFDRSITYDETLKLYANEILSLAESVIYKDQSYPEYCIENEL